MTQNILLTNDDLISDVRDGFVESVDFFAGSKIVIERKKNVDNSNNQEDDYDYPENGIRRQTDEDEVAGIEQLILGFSTPRISTSDVYDLNDVVGKESITSVVKSVIDAIIQFIKDIGEYLVNLFTNKLFRVHSRCRYTEQRRKIKGIKTSLTNYPISITKLAVPALISTNPSWVIAAGKEARSFYVNAIKAHEALREFINEKPKNRDELKSLKMEIFDKLGRTITNHQSKGGVYSTSILPGNRIYNIEYNAGKNGDEVSLYFTDSPAVSDLRKEKWFPVAAIVDEALSLNENLMMTVVREQKTTSSMINEFNRSVNDIKRKNENITNATKSYYIWLTKLNKRLSSSTLYYVINCIESLDDFSRSALL